MESFTLDNGLRVTLRPLRGAASAAVVALLEFGEGADPAGRSGMAHLCEHLWCTAAAGKGGVRTFEDLQRVYPLGSNFQTGRDSTVLATVVPAAGLGAELEDIAARFRGLRPVQADLDREKPRLLLELGNMWGGSAELAAANLARGLLTPGGPGRKGGVAAEVEAATLEEVRSFLDAHYRAGNARLVVAGGFDAGEVRALVEERFASLPRGEPPRLRAPAEGPPRSAEGPAVRVVRTGPDLFGQGTRACVGWRLAGGGPLAADPALLFLALRLQARSAGVWGRGARARDDARGEPRVVFAPLDDPEFLLVTAAPREGESPEQAVARLEAFVAEEAARPVKENEGRAMKLRMASLLGTMPVPDAMLAGNPYLAAFSAGRLEQMRLVGPEIGRSLEAVDDDALAALRETLLPRRAAVVVVPD